MKSQFISRLIASAVLGCASVVLFSSCDVIDAPYKENVKIDTTTSKTAVRKVLLEDFTGAKCSNCPEAAEVAKSLLSTYKSRVVLISVHAGFFAKTSPPMYVTDFTTSEGNQLNTDFLGSAGSYPSGLINRTQYNGTLPQTPDTWASLVSAVATDTSKPVNAIELAVSYNEATRTVTMTANVEYFKSSSADDRIVFAIAEDSIVAYQKDYRANPPDIPNYVHSHVLRGHVAAAAYGESFTGGEQPTTGKKYTIQRQFTLKNEWRSSKCNVIVYTLNPTTKEVYNVEEKAVTP